MADGHVERWGMLAGAVTAIGNGLAAIHWKRKADASPDAEAFTALSERMSRMESAVKKLEARHLSFEGRLEAHEAKMTDQHEEVLTKLNDRFQDLMEAIRTLANRMNLRKAIGPE